MARHKNLTPEARQYILEQMLEVGEITTEEVMQMIEPHFLFDPQTAREQQIRKLAHRLMGSIKDKNGQRNCFALQDEKTYINVDKTSDIEALAKVEKALKLKLVGLGSSYKKVRRRRVEVEGQISFLENAQ